MEYPAEKKENGEWTTVQPHFSKFKIIKNAVVLCVVFFITFTAYDCLSMLQSTLNHEKGLGVICQALVYGFYCISSLLLPKYVIQRLGCKMTLVLSMCLYVPYIASNLYPHFSFMVPAAIVNGLVASLLWGSQCQYLNDIAVFYAEETAKCGKNLYAKNCDKSNVEDEEKKIQSQSNQSFDNCIFNVDTEKGDVKKPIENCKCLNSIDCGNCNNKNEGKNIQTKPKEVFDNSTCLSNVDTEKDRKDGKCLKRIDSGNCTNEGKEEIIQNKGEQLSDESISQISINTETRDCKETTKDRNCVNSLLVEDSLKKDEERHIPNQSRQDSDESNCQLSIQAEKEDAKETVKDCKFSNSKDYNNHEIEVKESNHYKQIPDVSMCHSVTLKEIDCKALKERKHEEENNIIFRNSSKGSDLLQQKGNLYYDGIVNNTFSRNSVSLIEVPIIKGNKTISSKAVQSVTARFFGIFGMAYLSTHMISNVMSHFILENGVSNLSISINSSCKCGAQFCNDNSECLNHNLLEPSLENRNLLIGLCTGLGLISIVILAVFLDSLNDKKQNVRFSLELFMATTKHLKNTNQILLTPISLYVGMMQGFYMGDFNMSFVGCAWGTFHVALVSICYGAACGVSSPLSGYFVKQVGRVPIFIFATIINIGGQAVLLIWTPNAENSEIFFVIAALWGTAVGIFWSQVKAMYGFLFKNDQEVAFAAYHLWYSLGFALSFAYSNHFCTYIKIYVLICVMLLGIIGYLCLELRCKNQIKI